MSTPISTLIIKQLTGQITPEERIELDQYAAESEANSRMVAEYTDHERLLERVKSSYEWYREEDLQLINGKKPARVRSMWTYGFAAAVAIIAISLTWYFLSRNKQKPVVQYHPEPPAYFTAILKRGNGSVVHLHSLENGALADEPLVTKTDTQLAYPENHSIITPRIDTLETPTRSYYSIRLPDGSTVWLNCASSLVFPSSFSGAERIVQLVGEAYFEIAKDASRPFKVAVHGMEIQATGTKFNIKAYKEEGTVYTTLLEGSVKVRAGNYTASLQPGEQALLTSGKKIQKIKIDSAETQTLGWKHNQFRWTNEYIKNILADLSHWYGYTLDYKTNVPNITYDVTFNRSEPLEKILGIMRNGTGLKFKLINKRIVIYH